MVEKDGLTPQRFTQQMYDDPTILNLDDFLSKVEKGKPWQISTQLLLRLNGNDRRGKRVVAGIDERLKKHGLVCSPAIDVADYYGSVIISDPRDALPSLANAVAMPLSALDGGSENLISCGAEMEAVKVRTLMLQDDISQVPVLGSKKTKLLGVVTWKSLALYGGSLGDSKAADVMEPAGPIAQSSDHFMDWIDDIVAREFLIYSAPNGEISGIVTAGDLAKEFDENIGVYFELREIENRLRIILDRASISELREHLAPNRKGMKNFRGATDMTFGEYISALKDDQIWTAAKIQFQMDRKVFLDALESVRNIRNDIMHFSDNSDGEADGGSIDIRSVTARALRLVRAVPLEAA